MLCVLQASFLKPVAVLTATATNGVSSSSSNSSGRVPLTTDASTTQPSPAVDSAGSEGAQTGDADCSTTTDSVADMLVDVADTALEGSAAGGTAAKAALANIIMAAGSAALQAAAV